MKKIECWKTSDGLLHEDESVATRHEVMCAARQKYEENYLSRLVDFDDFCRYVRENEGIVVAILGVAK